MVNWGIITNICSYYLNNLLGQVPVAMKGKQQGVSRGSVSAVRKVVGEGGDISVTHGAGGRREGERGGRLEKWGRQTGEMGEGRKREGGRRRSKVEGDKDNGEGEEKKGSQKGEHGESQKREGEPLYPLDTVEIWVSKSDLSTHWAHLLFCRYCYAPTNYAKWIIEVFCYYSPALKKWGLYWICLVLPAFCGCVILWFCHSVIIQLKLRYLWGQLNNLDKILYEASLGWGKGCIQFRDRLDQNSGFQGNKKRPLTYNGENDASTFSLFFFFFFFFFSSDFFFKLASNEDGHKISDKFEFRHDRTTDYGVSCPWASEKFPIDLEWENGVSKLARSFLIGSFVHGMKMCMWFWWV